jgi:small subunit ribosomal protein S20
VANTKSAKKEARRSVARTLRNRSARSAVKTRIARFRRGVDEGVENVNELVVIAISALDRAASKGIVHKKNAARRKSRLMKRLSGAGEAAAAATKPKATKPKGATKPKAAATRTKTRKA